MTPFGFFCFLLVGQFTAAAIGAFAGGWVTFRFVAKNVRIVLVDIVRSEELAAVAREVITVAANHAKQTIEDEARKAAAAL